MSVWLVLLDVRLVLSALYHFISPCRAVSALVGVLGSIGGRCPEVRLSSVLRLVLVGVHICRSDDRLLDVGLFYRWQVSRGSSGWCPSGWVCSMWYYITLYHLKQMTACSGSGCFIRGRSVGSSAVMSVCGRSVVPAHTDDRPEVRLSSALCLVV